MVFHGNFSYSFYIVARDAATPVVFASILLLTYVEFYKIILLWNITNRKEKVNYLLSNYFDLFIISFFTQDCHSHKKVYCVFIIEDFLHFLFNEAIFSDHQDNNTNYYVRYVRILNDKFVLFHQGLRMISN